MLSRRFPSLTAALTLLVLGCGPARYPLPDRVSITLIDATVAPFDARGMEWDGSAPVAASLVSGLASALSHTVARGETERKAASVISFVAEAAGRGIAAPDPQGWAEVLSPGALPLRQRLAQSGDNLRPRWSGVRWSGVPLTPDTRLRIFLEDADPIGANDVIGTIEVGYDDLVEALDAQKLWQVAVADQSNDQLLYVGISVSGD